MSEDTLTIPVDTTAAELIVAALGGTADYPGRVTAPDSFTTDSRPSVVP